MKSVLKKSVLPLAAVILIGLCTFQSLGASSYGLLKDKGLDERYLEGLSDTILDKLTEKLSDAGISDITYDTDVFPILSEVEDTNFVTINVRTDKGRVLCVYWREAVTKSSGTSEHYVHLKWDEDAYAFESDSFYAEDYGKNDEVSASYTALADIQQGSIGHFSGTGAGAMVFSLEAKSPDSEANDYLEIHYLSEDNSLFIGIGFSVLVIIIVLSLAYIMKMKKKAKMKKN